MGKRKKIAISRLIIVDAPGFDPERPDVNDFLNLIQAAAERIAASPVASKASIKTPAGKKKRKAVRTKSGTLRVRARSRSDKPNSSAKSSRRSHPKKK
jgi:hypothetical protein